MSEVPDQTRDDARERLAQAAALKVGDYWTHNAHRVLNLWLTEHRADLLSVLGGPVEDWARQVEAERDQAIALLRELLEGVELHDSAWDVDEAVNIYFSAKRQVRSFLALSDEEKA